MKQLILKELREHVKVALLGLTILTVILLHVFTASSSQVERMALAAGYNYGAANTLQPLLAEDLLAEVSIFCAIFGVLLGWLQIRAEKHPDLWAFLVHRPIHRTRILWSKGIAGLILYALAAALPLIGFVVVVLIPGNVAAPFEWAMTLPIVAIFLAGIAYYLAGLLTGLRRARWYGSRGFGLGLAIIASFSLFAVAEFWQALLIIVFAGVVLAAAVWGSFQTGGYYRDQPVAGKLALTAACVASTAVVMSAALAGGTLLFSPRAKYSISHYQLSRDGTIYKVTQNAFEISEIVDLNGKPLLDEKTGRKIKWTDFQRLTAPGWSTTVHFENGPKGKNVYNPRYHDMARFFSPWHVFDKTLWYLTADGRLVAYHGITRKRVGSLEPQESSAVRSPKDSRFIRAGDYSYSYLQPYTQPEILASTKTAYLVDLEKRALRPLFTVTNGDVIGGYAQNVSYVVPSTVNRALIVTRSSLRLLDFEGRTLMQVPYDPVYPAYPSVSVYGLEPTNTFAARFDPDDWFDKKSGGKLLSHIAWVDARGTIGKTIDLPKLPEPRSDQAVEKLLSALLPPAVPVYSWEPSDRIWTLLRIVLAGLSALTGWRLGQRNSFSAKANVGWGVFHLLFGIPGLLAFLAVEEWPARESCPNCGKLRVVERKQCEHCGAGFPPPEKTGIEIFEPLAAR